MKLIPIALVLLLAGCASTSQQIDAAHSLGVINAGVNLADQPAECAVNTPHVALNTGDDVRILLRRERSQLDVANGKRADCYLFNKVQIDGLRSVAPKK